MNRYEFRFTTLDGTVREGLLLILAVGNGRQCGGGYQVAPKALPNDGLLDVVVVHDADVQQFGSCFMIACEKTSQEVKIPFIHCDSYTSRVPSLG